jgi:serralysin
MARKEGDAGNNTINGTGQIDVIYGYGGNDRLSGWGGNDTLFGGYGNDFLFGNEGDDVLDGGPGADVLRGGAGSDIYRGGAGRDRFVFSDVTSNGSTNERVFDYQDGEVLDFSIIDADSTRAGNQAFTFVRDGQFNGRPGELITAFLGTGTDLHTRIYVDTDGNGLADLFVTLENGWFGMTAGENLIL